MSIEYLKKIFGDCWSYETCSPSLKNIWNNNNPSLGQCAVTALIVNDLFGGKIMRCMTSSGSHYYNLINDTIVDLTVEQFLDEIPLYDCGQERTREYLLSNKDTEQRYILLNNLLKENIIKQCKLRTKTKP